MNREKPRLCLVFAMGMEMGPFLERVQPVQRWSHGKAAYREVFFEGSHLLVVRCGIGPERAAASIKNLRERPDILISVGTAGALTDDLRVGDMVIASETVSTCESGGPLVSDAALVGLLALACAKEGKSLVSPQLFGATNHELTDKRVVRSPSLKTEDLSSPVTVHGETGIVYPASCATGRGIAPHDAGNQSVPRLPRGDLPLNDNRANRVPTQPGQGFCVGRVVTVRDAVFSPEERARLRHATQATAVEMETYAIASAANDLGVPHACLRVISDDFRSPPIPLRKSPRMAWNRPLAIPGDLVAKLRWRRFLKKFERSIAELPPVLVRFMREL
ncbi:MAG: hypothetical protein AB1646_05190 [Thermodesulfobacteriota bacterium]